jgi:prevent-host-death family protein
MTTFIVTVAEAREHLAELITRVVGGDRVVIAESGKSVAQLIGPPMFPTTPEEIETTREKREATIREWLGLREDAPVPRPDDMTWEEYFDKYRARG